MTRRKGSFVAAGRILATSVALWAAGCSCGDDGSARDDSASATMTLTLTGTETDTLGTDTDSQGTDSDTGMCPPDRMCDAVCCDEGQLCQVGECVTDCGGVPPCGIDEVCCEGEEICYAGSCTVPGADCQVAGCATSTDSDCNDEEVCDPVLGKCVPKQANDTCIYMPPPAVFDPVPLFTWGERRVRNCTVDTDCQKEELCQGGTCQVTWPHVAIAMDDMPEWTQVTSTPMVADLDLDCVPEIIFNSYRNSVYTSDGILRAIRGDTGAKVWTITDPNFRTDGTANPAVGDLDGDGQAEVVVQGAGKYLVAVDSNGALLWVSDNFSGGENSGSTAIANLDGEGAAEVIFGGAVYSALGNLVWEGTTGIGLKGQGPISCIADLDGDSRPELIGGRTAYTFTGTVQANNFAGQQLWDAGSGDGYCGIADFQGDGLPEVVLVRNSVVHVLDGQSGVSMAQLNIVGGGQGGAPNIADFNGDGTPDIGTAGGSNYVVMVFDGVSTLQTLWQAGTEDDSSSRTGSSVFDFDGDGSSEVIYNDEEFIRIYPGVEPDCAVNGPNCDGVMTDPEALFQDLSSSRTRTEYPVIADANGDFKAEIVFATNNEADFLDPNLRGDAGIEVWRDRLDNWMPTRPVWNQHSYHITNVEVAGGIPTQEADNWTTPPGDPYNSYRRNTQGEVNFCAPDLIPLDLQFEPVACPELELSVWVLNQGCLGVGPGVNVAFYEQDLGLLGVVQTQNALVPGAAEKVTLSVPALMGQNYSVWVVVDDDGMGMGVLNECDEDNNEHEPVTACPIQG